MTEIAEQIEAEARAKDRASPGTTSSPNERVATIERQPRSKDSSGIFKQGLDDEAPLPSGESEERQRTAERANYLTKKKRVGRAGEAGLPFPGSERVQNDFDPSGAEGYASMTPKTHQSNSFNQPEAEADPGEESDLRAQGSMKGVSRVLNAAKFVFRDAKSKSISQKTSRSANVKLTPGPASASVKKLLQGSLLRAAPTTPSPPNTLTKSFEDPPGAKPPQPGSAREQSGDQGLSFKKPGKDSLFSRVAKTASPGLSFHYSSTDERGAPARDG